jgi:peptide/nickel transport system substrate-binding protein
MVSGSLAVIGTESTKERIFLFFPGTGMFKEYTLPSGLRPQHISIEDNGTVIRAWFNAVAGNSMGEIVYDPVSATARVYEVILPAEAGNGANDVHASSGIIWFASKNAIVKWDRSTSRFTTWTIPPHPSTQPAFVEVDALGQVWYTSAGTSTTGVNSYVGVLRSDNTFTEWQFPATDADLSGISVSLLTGNPWVTQRGGDSIATLNPSTGGIVTSRTPITARSDPIAEAIFTHVAGPALPSTVIITPSIATPTMSSTDQFTAWTLTTGSRPNDVVVDASGDVWILQSSVNKVARLSLVSDFLIGCNPSSLIMVQDTNGTSTCTVTSIDGFASAVELAGSWVGTEPHGVAYTLPTPVTPPPGRGESSTLIISAGPQASTGTFTFRVTGKSSSMTHSVNLTVTIAAGVADFTIMASPSSLSIPPGGSVTSTIAVQSLGVFFSPVNLASSGAPGGMSLFFATNPVTPPIGGMALSVVTVTVSGAPVGTYAITITGASDSLTHATVITAQIPGAGGPCLIATATYGSELTDEVQFLRNFRDNSILKTKAGSNFMAVFNAWYYSFSPSVAQLIREHPTVRTAAKFTLYPLIGILRIGAASFSLFPTNMETGAIVSGLLVSALIALVYLAIPLTALFAFSPRARRIGKGLQMPLVLLGALATLATAIAIGAPATVIMITTSTIVLSNLAASAIFASRVVLRIAKNQPYF